MSDAVEKVARAIEDALGYGLHPIVSGSVARAAIAAMPITMQEFAEKAREIGGYRTRVGFDLQQEDKYTVEIVRDYFENEWFCGSTPAEALALLADAVKEGE